MVEIKPFPPELDKKSDLKIDFDDGSTFEMNIYWEEAMTTKGKDNGMDVQETLDYVRDSVDEYWNDKRTMDKFGDHSWESDDQYKTKAALCEDIGYAWIRAYLFGIVFREIAKEKGTTPVKVVTLDEDGMHEITPEGKKDADLDEGN